MATDNQYSWPKQEYCVYFSAIKNSIINNINTFLIAILAGTLIISFVIVLQYILLAVRYVTSYDMMPIYTKNVIQNTMALVDDSAMSAWLSIYCLSNIPIMYNIGKKLELKFIQCKQNFAYLMLTVSGIFFAIGVYDFAKYQNTTILETTRNILIVYTIAMFMLVIISLTRIYMYSLYGKIVNIIYSFLYMFMAFLLLLFPAAP